MNKLFSLNFCFLILFFQASAQSQTKADSLLIEISNLQTAGISKINTGLFFSKRGKKKLNEDDNIFFSSLITFTLQNSQKQTKAQNVLIDSICAKAIYNYKWYKNQKGNCTYNFWKTNPPNFFPNSKLSNHQYFNIPDDADCTSLIHLTDTSLNSQTLALKKKFDLHSNLSTLKIKNTFWKYRNYTAYSTWFGKNMPIEFDICVQANMLYFVFENNLKLNSIDSATIDLIRVMILSGDYLKHSNYISPSYKKKSIILYHLSRLVGTYTVSGLNDCKVKIKNDIEIELNKHQSNFMDKILLSTSLIRMGGKPLLVVYPTNSKKQMDEFAFFNADLFSPYARPGFKFISEMKIFTIPFYCTAYNLALLYEYETLKNNRN